ncbi:MAG: PIN domain-containing protein [Nitrospirae bacterium]|nr:PIN domain-containing protein [Nitrospirota bacterium]
MSDKVFIDTNILLYAYDIDAGIKHNIAREVIRRCWEEASGVISIQVLSEFFARATREGGSFVSVDEAESIVKNLSHSWTVIIPDVPVVLEAIRGRKVHQLSFWDALIWAAAKQAKINTVYTEDFQHGRVVEGVSFVNPFKTETD